LGLAGGLAWGLPLMRPDRWHGIVGNTAGSSASPRRGARAAPGTKGV